jgi:ATP adenylyltransferase
MRRIWAPWRIEYIRNVKVEGCIFCQKLEENQDAKNYILFRGTKNFVVLNLYPYNPGHLLVAPYRHVPDLDDLTEEEMLEHFDLVRRSKRALADEYKPQGFNIGINLGRVAGAGVEDHVHTHIIPRWNGDTNVVTVMSDVRVIPHALDATYAELVGKIEEVKKRRKSRH